MGKRAFFVTVLVLAVGALGWWQLLAAPGGETGVKIISFADETPGILVAEKLARQGFVKNEWTTALVLAEAKIPAGGYELSKSMNLFEVAKVMRAGPQLLWVIVPPGWRKEQIADKLVPKFGWSEKDREDFLSYPEGEYFPDTYLVPRHESGAQVGQRMVNHFNEAFAPYVPKFLAANIKNDTALKIASLLQRESGGDDMSLISGIIWNRLLKGMQLKIDATVQYAKGKVDGQWWSRVSVSDYTSVESDYNTYLHKGLPPGPIASPGLAAIDAVLNPVETDCLYYLHDPSGQIHCSQTYEGHLENVEKYLR